jgi:ferrochelatase
MSDATRGARRAVLLSNLGSPASPGVGDVRRYLDEFLMDARVLDTPWLLRRFIVSAFILPKRPAQSAHAYRSIWWDEGSPLIVLSRRVFEKVRARVDVPVELSMRYGEPSIADAIDRLLAAPGGDIDEILFVPLYPHYAMSTVETGVVRAREVLSRRAPRVRLAVLPPFYDHPRYIDALVDAAREHLDRGYDHLLFSYHGLPERHLRKTDPTGAHCLRRPDCCETPSPAHATCYRAQVFKTTAAFVEKAGIAAEKYSVAFQSRLGRDPWLRPFADAEIGRLGRGGVGRLLVMCPAFVSDCLETLEEIGIRGRETFEAAGGGELTLIPCLNENPKWIDALVDWCAAGELTPAT